MHHPISIGSDIVFANAFAFLTPHDYLGPIPPSPLAPMKAPVSIALEPPVTMMWPPGMGLGQNKFAMTVLHKGQPICQAGHDCGHMIPHIHVAPSPANSYTVLQMTFSSRKNLFAASTVLKGGAPTACNAMPTMMAQCADPIDLPLSFSLTSHSNTVRVGMTWMDVFFAIGLFAAQSALKMFLDKKFPGPDGIGAAPVMTSKKAIQNAVLKELGSKVGENLRDANLKKIAISLMTQTAKYGRSASEDGFENAKGQWSISVGSPYLVASEIAIKVEGDEISRESSARSELPGLLTDKDEIKVVSDKDGYRTELTGTTVDGSQTSSTGQKNDSKDQPPMQPRRWGQEL